MNYKMVFIGAFAIFCSYLVVFLTVASVPSVRAYYNSLSPSQEPSRKISLSPASVCGNYLCESGESPENCCHDCSCVSGYCDLQEPISESSCKQDPTNINVHVSSIRPSYFYTHITEDNFSFFVEIDNIPSTLKMEVLSCALKCLTDNGSACSARCSNFQCRQIPSSNASVYNSTCSITFSIADYNPLRGYSIIPQINFSASYKNGSTQTISKILSTTIPAVNIGAHLCGDRKCDPDETKENCCYDCGCVEGQYCYTQNMDYPSLGDSCRLNPTPRIDSITSTVFTDSYEQHEINVTGHIENRPAGLSITPTCSFGNADISCYTSCDIISQTDSSMYGFLCHIFVPPIDYNTSSLYDHMAKKITIGPGNSLNLTLSYNNGSVKGSEEFSFPVPPVVINVIPRCGVKECEREVGENGANCCLDCGCSEYGSGYFCYTGTRPNGECLSVSVINIRVLKIEPDPINCTILEQKGECIFSRSLKIYPEVIRPPSDLELLGAYYRITGSGIPETYSEYKSLNCYEQAEHGKYSCALVLDNINKSSPGTENRTIELKMSVAYTINGSLAFKNISDSATFTIKRSYSEALASCIQQQQSIERKLKDLESDKTLYTVLTVIFFIISLFFWILYLTSCFSQGCNDLWKTIAIIAAIVGGCGLAFVLNRLSSIDGKIQSLQAQKQGICAASTFGELSGSTSSASTWIYTIGELYGGITCMMGVMGAVGGLSWGGTTSTGGNVVGGVSQPSWMSDYATPGNAWRFNTPVTTDI